MSEEIRILFVEDTPEDWELARHELLRSGLSFSCIRVETEAEFTGSLESFSPDIIVSDYSLPEFNGRRALDISISRDPGLPFIILTGSMNETTAVECMKAGASDYVLKRHIQQLPFAVKEALERKRERREGAKALERIRESEQNYRNLADSGQALLWTSGLDMNCDWFNSVWLAFTGRKMEEETGEGWMDNVHPDDLTACINTYVEAFQRREAFTMSYRLKRHDGEYRWIQDNGTPRNDANGKFIGFIGHCLDITKHKNAESEIRHSLDERDVLLRELYHRINNNLQIIISLLDMQSARTEDEIVHRFFLDVENRIVSMSLIHQQLYRARDLSHIDLSEYLRELSEQLYENFSVDMARVEFECDVDPIMTLVDTALPLGMVYNELLTNSLKHAFPGNRKGKISLSVRKKVEGRIEIAYSDDGVGVPSGFDFRSQSSIGLLTIFGISENQLFGKATVKTGNGLSWHLEMADNLYAKRV